MKKSSEFYLFLIALCILVMVIFLVIYTGNLYALFALFALGFPYEIWQAKIEATDTKCPKCGHEFTISKEKEQ